MIPPEKAQAHAVNLIIGLLLRGKEGKAVALANKLKCFLGLSETLAVEGITRNNDFYQIAVKDKLTGKGALYALGSDGSAWEWGPGAWLPLPPSHPLVGLGKIPELHIPVLDG